MGQNTSSLSKARCEGIGNIAMCLYYLSSRARASNMEDIAELIEQTISTAVGLGAEDYREYLQGILDKRETSGKEFVKNFCPVDDEAVRLSMLEILNRQETSGATHTEIMGRDNHLQAKQEERVNEHAAKFGT